MTKTKNYSAEKTEMHIWISNTENLYAHIIRMEEESLKKAAAGKYTRAAAIRLWRRVVNDGATYCAKSGGRTFPKLLCEEIATEMVEEFEETGEFRNLRPTRSI